MVPPPERRSDLAGSKRKVGASSSGTQQTETPPSKRRKVPDAVEDSVDHATNTGRALLDRLRNARDKKNWPIATHFLTLPDPKVVPDYYEQIGLPVALDTIEAKLDRRAYQTTSALESDIKRMIANAKQYNEKVSQVFADAEKIRKMVSVFMEDRNPAYRTGTYQPVPTPIPENWRERLKQDPVDASEEALPAPSEDITDGPKSTRKSGRNPAPSPAIQKAERRASSTPAVGDAEDAGESFEGNTFQQAQDKIITEMINLTDDDNTLISANFLNLPSRALLDYYRMIKHPVCLKGVQKKVRGVKGREPPTGVSLFKSWDAFEDEVGYIWRNAREYNEDGSEISTLAGELQSYFEGRLAEAKSLVTEPPQPKVKLTMKPAQENPKITLKFGGPKQDVAARGSMESETASHPRDSVRGLSNGEQPNREASHDQSAQAKSTEVAQSTREQPESRSSEQTAHVNGVKREVSHGHSPALPTTLNVNGNGDIPTPSAPPPATSAPRVASDSPHPVVNGSVPSSHSVSTSVNSRLRQKGKDASDALILNLNIRTHPELDMAPKFEYNIPASATRTQQSVTVYLASRQWRLLICPTLSPTLMQRPSKTFVTCNHRRLQALPQSEVDHRQRVYEHKLVPGTNVIEVEVIAGMPRGAPKVGSGQEIELEKFTVFAHYRQ